MQISNDTDLVKISKVMDEVLKVRTKRSLIPKSYSTNRAYASDLADFMDWCDLYGYQSLPATDREFSLYIVSLILNGYKTSTIKRRIVAICQAHLSSGFLTPKTSLVNSVIIGVNKTYGTDESSKKSINKRMLNRLIEVLPQNLKGARDKAILLLGYEGLFNRSELVSINFEDIKFDQYHNLIVHFEKTRSNQRNYKEGTLTLNPNEKNCPVSAVKEWVVKSEIRSGALFRSINKHGHLSDKRLSDKGVALIVKEYVKLAGFSDDLYSSSSLRNRVKTHKKS
ncbi:site-specific recombinase XerD [Paenibacillus peoriae]|uniref:Site-specific recombinase XerD n=1 Tax=Paenibacillus peoriae TaxID=59893 RepID=A0ABU1QL83_9BACL|nr:tyrosine-type recombinase/integrase [Paenibacillus peoriae]MDR6780401.1 site-specific recombinase XerD [Paenibacillus peoriae]